MAIPLRICLVWLALVMSPCSAFALCNQPNSANSQNYDGNGQACVTLGKTATFAPLGCLPWQAITSGSAVALSAFSGGIPAGATLVDIVPSVTVILRDDGSAPTTAGPGIPIQANTIYPYSGSLSAAQFIAQTTSGTIAACFFK